MKAITIKQPFATLIAEGLKEYEFRTWKTNYRGDILIHAGKTLDKEAMKRFEHLNLDYPLGCIIAKASLTDCVEIDETMKGVLRKKNYVIYEGTTESDNWHGYGFKLKNICKISPILTNGKLSLWDYEGEVMKKGYDIFGKAYGIMMRNDLHDPDSIDHKFMKEMILLDEESRAFLYDKNPEQFDMTNHELYTFAKQFKGSNDKQTIENILLYTANIADNCNDDFSEMKFGGTEKEILTRGTDWCADMSRVGAVLLACNGIPARIIHLVNLNKAYNGHVVVEAYYEGKYGVCDFLYGYNFYSKEPLDAYTLMSQKQYLENYPDDYVGLYSAVAINEYNPMDKSNNYIISTPNQYTMNIINTNHNDKWFMGEDL